VAGEAWDRFVASDPGLLRLTAGLRTVAAIALAAGVLAGLGAPAPLLVAGAITAMVATFAIVETRRGDQARTLALGLPVALAAVSLGAALNPYVVLGDAFFVALIFSAVYARRFGERGTALGLIGFQVYFVSQFVHATVGMLPRLAGTLAVAFAGAALARFVLVPATPELILYRLRRAFRVRLARVVATAAELVAAREPDGEDEGERLARTVADLRRDTARLHESALMIQGRLEDGTRDAAEAESLQRRIADAEIAAERLALLLVKARTREGTTDTLTLHLPTPLEPRPAPDTRTPDTSNAPAERTPDTANAPDTRTPAALNAPAERTHDALNAPDAASAHDAPAAPGTPAAANTPDAASAHDASAAPAAPTAPTAANAPGAVACGGDPVAVRLRRDLAGLHTLITRFAPDDRSTALTVIRNRLLEYREEDNLPRDALTERERDVFRGIGEAARAVLGLRMPLDGPQDETDDSPEAARSREELETEDLFLARGEDEERPAQTGLARPTTRAAFQVAAGSALAVVGGELLSPQRWYWAVLTCWVVFLNTASTGEILVKGYRRLLGTVVGVVAGVGLAGAVGHHTWTALALVLLCVFGMFFTAPLSYALMSFFVTAMLGLLYTLLHTYSFAVLVLRIEETALGAVCGAIAALLVLPVRTDERTDQQLRTVLIRLREAAGAAMDRLSGERGADLLDLARELDTALDDFRRSTHPLTHPITPLRVRKRTARYLVALLETCAYQTRSLAAIAELMPTSRRIAADPRLAGAGRRIRDNLDVLVEHLEHEHAGGQVESGASVASMLEGPRPDVPPGTVAFRVLRHIQRLDEGVVGLARPLGVSVVTSRADRGKAGPTRDDGRDSVPRTA
jgi:hypothetical protein